MDSGAIGVNGIREKGVVLEVAREVIRLNKELYNNHLDIYLTRYTDTLISLADRTKLPKALQADVYVSIHCNQATRKEAQGIEVYIQHPKDLKIQDYRRESEYLAQSILDIFHNSLGYKIRGRKYANFQVLRETQSSCQGVLLELGFLSNTVDAAHSKRRESITGFAIVILQALIKESKRMD
ncbi:N-acetylmuramoyl-L-alanine amidase LytC [Arenibacter antarcticus]|uniref:N-acetylmuramoyl-L-alanine amidase n=1 Tax=Arenibacter antarcticus TaxID=2040469 RepID=A0ABW5VDC3_9FLAO|nr:N-acetylmuramoyl-L-alanine amidase [Arenibacter sp. H213]